MRYNYMQRFLSIAMLAAFCAPTGFAYPYSNTYDTPYNNQETSSTLSAGVGLTQSNSHITLSLRDSDVKQVLRMFADKAGLNIVFHKSVKGKVTLDLVDMPINDAFNLVLQVSNLNYYKQNNTIIIIGAKDADNASFSKQEMMTFPVKYVSAASIAKFLNKNVFSMRRPGLSGVDAATVNSATNEIIVFGMPSDAAIVRKVIAQLDKEPLSRTFYVNHTTPAQMADMVCNVLLPSRGVSGSRGNDEQEFMPAAAGVGTGGAAGILTGGAASTGGESGDITLGEGVVACSASASSSSPAASAFSMQNLSIAYFPQRGTILVTGGSEAQLEMVEKFIKENDKKQPQAYVEIAILELNEDGSKTFQNIWNLYSTHWNFKFDGTGTSGGRESKAFTTYVTDKIPVLNSDGVTYSLKDTVVRSNVHGGPFVSWTMNYVIENKKGRVLANPKIIVTNGQESVIDMTQDYVEKVTSEYLSSTTSNSGGSSGTVERTYTIGDDLGIKLTLTPFISNEGYVTMNLKPDYSVVKEDVTAPFIHTENGRTVTYNDKVATLLSRRNLDLKNVRVRDGETLVLGGMIQEGETKTVSKIPVLGDLPIVGAAFRSTSTSKSKNELVIMITPRIIQDGEELSDNL